MSAEYIPSYHSQRYESTVPIDQVVVDFRPKKSDVSDEAVADHTNDEAMRGVELDRTTKADREHQRCEAVGRRAIDSILDQGDIYSD